MELGEFLRALRGERRQSDIAAKSGTTKATLSRWETGSSRPGCVRDLEQVLDALDASERQRRAAKMLLGGLSSSVVIELLGPLEVHVVGGA